VICAVLWLEKTKLPRKTLQWTTSTEKSSVRSAPIAVSAFEI
jgi:hypothetical protein